VSDGGQSWFETLSGDTIETDEAVPTMATKIAHYRLLKKWAVAELSRRCGINESTVRSYESGGRMPPLDKAVAIAKAMDVNVVDLLASSKSKLASSKGRKK
jgi:transcriptional regulator with XRE-family HTH domain